MTAEFTQSEIDAAFEDVLKQQADIITTLKAEVERLKALLAPNIWWDADDPENGYDELCNLDVGKDEIREMQQGIILPNNCFVIRSNDGENLVFNTEEEAQAALEGK